MVKAKKNYVPVIFRGVHGYSCRNEMLWDLSRSSIGQEVGDINVFIDGIRSVGFSDLGHFPLMGTIKPEVPQYQFCSMTYQSFSIYCFIYTPDNLCFMSMIAHPNRYTMENFWRFCLGTDLPDMEEGSIRIDDVLNRQYEHVACSKEKFAFLGNSFAVVFTDKTREFKNTNIAQEFLMLVA